MTGEKALEIIKAYKKKLENSCSNQLDEDIKAFDLAIKALERSENLEQSVVAENAISKTNQDLTKSNQGSNQGDLISREALKTLEYINKGNFNTVEGIREWIDNAPTVGRSQGERIPVKYRPLTVDERIANSICGSLRH
jgi:hypothetical protein